MRFLDMLWRLRVCSFLLQREHPEASRSKAIVTAARAGLAIRRMPSGTWDSIRGPAITQAIEAKMFEIVIRAAIAKVEDQFK